MITQAAPKTTPAHHPFVNFTEASPKEVLVVVGMIVEIQADDGPAVIIGFVLDLKLESAMAAVLTAVMESMETPR